MKAAQIKSYGGKEVMQTVENVEKPKAGPDQVLVSVKAAAANPFDLKVREGYMKDFLKLELPAILGGDVAGTVKEIGENVSGFAVGQAVYGQASAVGGQGSFAEYTPVKASQLTNKPAGTDFVQAAATPLAATSAYQALIEHINLKPGQKVLIHGGAGGIGSFAIQTAKYIGAYVATTVSKKDFDFAKQLGADELIDYQSQDFASIVKDYDAVFDTVGGETNTKSYEVLKEGGTLVSMVAPPNEDRVKAEDITYIHQGTKTTVDKLNKIAELVDNGKIKVYVDKVFPLNEAAEALEYLKTGRPQGKVVIKVSA